MEDITYTYGLCPDVVDIIYQLTHKSYITEIHTELHDSFKGVYKTNMYDMKYDEVSNAIGENYAQIWMDSVVPDKKREVYEEHYNAKKLSKILSDKQQEYMMEQYISNDEYDLETWWEYNKAFETGEELYNDYEYESEE
jgi:hypothetical protein